MHVCVSYMLLYRLLHSSPVVCMLNFNCQHRQPTSYAWLIRWRDRDIRIGLQHISHTIYVTLTEGRALQVSDNKVIWCHQWWEMTVCCSADTACLASSMIYAHAMTKDMNGPVDETWCQAHIQKKPNHLPANKLYKGSHGRSTADSFK